MDGRHECKNAHKDLGIRDAIFKEMKVTERPQAGLQDTIHGPREMAQWLRIMTDLPGDPGSIPSTHMVAHSL